MKTLSHLTLLLLTVATLAGCRNECQKVCVQMAELFDECGEPYSSDEVVECLETYQEPDAVTLGTCAETLGELDQLMEYKSGTGDACDEIGRYSLE